MADMDASMASSFDNISEPSTSQPSIIDHPFEGSDSNDGEDLDDLPSPSVPDSDEITTSDEGEYNGESDAEREWKESVQQLELLLSMVLVPYLGKYFGRKFAYWGKLVFVLLPLSILTIYRAGWKQYMEWKYPVEVVITSKAAFRGAGAVGVAATL